MVKMTLTPEQKEAFNNYYLVKNKSESYFYYRYNSHLQLKSLLVC